MRKHYDFTSARKNPYAKSLKKQVTIRIEETTLAYFKRLAAELPIPYQTLINMFSKTTVSAGAGRFAFSNQRR